MKPAALSLLAAAVMLGLPDSGMAQDYSTDYFDIAAFQDGGGCWLNGDWTLAGRAAVNLELDLMTDGEIYAGVWSDGWSRPRADLRKVLGMIFWGPGETKQVFALFAVPSGAERTYVEKPGLYAVVQADERDEFLAAFASSRSVTVVSRDTDAADGVEFDTILEGGLQGSALALTRLRACALEVGRREAAAAAREEAIAHIDRDPFKSDVPSSTPQVPGVLVNPNWSRPPLIEFPERAASRGVTSGQVDLDCMINANGSLTGCSIASESPAGMGFGGAAMTGTRRARVAPRDVDDAGPGGRARFTIRFAVADGAGPSETAPPSVPSIPVT